MSALSAEDRLAILELVFRADRLATERDAAGYAALFAEDGEMVGDEGTARGRTEIARAVAAVWAAEAATTIHLTCNPTIEEPGSEVAVASLMVILDPSSPAPVAAVAAVRQGVARTIDGWRIAAREIKVKSPPEKARADVASPR